MRVVVDVVAASVILKILCCSEVVVGYLRLLNNWLARESRGEPAKIFEWQRCVIYVSGVLNRHTASCGSDVKSKYDLGH
jgi:hypothetical protein